MKIRKRGRIREDTIPEIRRNLFKNFLNAKIDDLVVDILVSTKNLRIESNVEKIL